MSGELKRTEKTRLRRIPKRGNFDREIINAILDDAFLCHVGFSVASQPYVIPTSYGRVGENLYIHGSAASRMLKNLAGGIDVCVTITILDGLVLARSAFNHSMNYRSVVILGKAEMVADPDEKDQALFAISEQIIPGRWNEVRPPTKLELKATSVLKVPITEASAKIRSGPPIDDDDDYALDVWAGVLPMTLTSGEPLSDPRLKAGIELPPSVRVGEKQ